MGSIFPTAMTFCYGFCQLPVLVPAIIVCTPPSNGLQVHPSKCSCALSSNCLQLSPHALPSLNSLPAFVSKCPTDHLTQAMNWGTKTAMLSIASKWVIVCKELLAQLQKIHKSHLCCSLNMTFMKLIETKEIYRHVFAADWFVNKQSLSNIPHPPNLSDELSLL